MNNLEGLELYRLELCLQVAVSPMKSSVVLVIVTHETLKVLKLSFHFYFKLVLATLGSFSEARGTLQVSYVA